LPHPFFKEKAADIFDATRRAGRELVESGRVLPGTMARIKQPLAAFDFYSMMGNLFWKTCIAEKVTPKEFEKRHMIPHPDSIESFMALFPVGINAGAAGDRKVVMQFDFSGEIEGSCSFLIEKGAVTAKKGTLEHPDITIKTPFELWIDIMTRKADGQQMFMEQKYTVAGDLGLMIELFKRKGGQS
jgi:putative sterol carrier protein